MAADADSDRRAELLESLRDLLDRLDVDLIEQDEADDHQTLADGGRNPDADGDGERLASADNSDDGAE
ncbi:MULTISPECIES: hypothetical protein [unclassified Solwaraspora]|uniref:hypothetical protein n=1 Tax=unclassified Solwaraspora TaxID=2627926 RepID=UPI00248C3211|nr:MULTISPECIES: hypothetical protein [unclassified Solwaraspora]WBB98067.1 hypothetical protein O7553_03675 [Solwaraspora sp. WMMA2059]WBC23378.1 hypothetical protein O7543_13685 [Solwaraspora sp. WMMA2080]WJK34540.1 hypothetical protein O7610_28760 [Solwaraspora sp. WMMA2065]